jgi:hypothetical protein
VNIHNDERILKNFSVLSQGWHDFQQVRHLFIFLAWLYPLSPDFVVGVVPQAELLLGLFPKQSVVEDFVFFSSSFLSPTWVFSVWKFR